MLPVVGRVVSLGQRASAHWSFVRMDKGEYSFMSLGHGGGVSWNKEGQPRQSLKLWKASRSATAQLSHRGGNGIGG